MIITMTRSVGIGIYSNYLGWREPAFEPMEKMLSGKLDMKILETVSERKRKIRTGKTSRERMIKIKRDAFTTQWPPASRTELNWTTTASST